MQTTVLLPPPLPEAERSAVRLDGDGFALGLDVVPVGAWVDAALRAATLAAATSRHALVVDSWAAAWVHGAWPVLPTPLPLAVELGAGPRTRALHPAPREVRFAAGDVEVLGGVKVVTAFRCAYDLARLADPFEGVVVAVVRDLLAIAGLDPAGAATRSLALPSSAGKTAAFDRLLSLRADGGRPGQPAETR